MVTFRHFNRDEIDALPRRFRANLFNTAHGVKPANLVGTVNAATGVTNLAIFNSAIHIGANPPLVGLLFRPVGEVPRHTYENIRATGVYTINQVRPEFASAAHRTSAKFGEDESEFEHCGFTAVYEEGFGAPFVGESAVRLGVRYVEEIKIERNGTILVIGEIEHVFAEAALIGEDGSIDNASGTASSGLDTYLKLEEVAKFEYAKKD